MEQTNNHACKKIKKSCLSFFDKKKEKWINI